ncbi:RNase adapter RapZ [Paucidesulfovibrio longus]|uniref:RNase adapter RapZ n=1 Tax=Paucidesulfovibrio longus TaxID=889 RepID=UPI0003B63F19|nr:RNase adapter RapZ [Paucidesulfovibrio longus]
MKKDVSFPVIVVTGLSGAGKSTALNVFEDLGFFCVDGLPAGMLPKMVELFRGMDKDHRGLALGMDLRQVDFVEEWERASTELAAMGVKVQVVFLETRQDKLLTRYATTRRLHPLESNSLGLEQALEKERQLLGPIRTSADLVIDTTGYSIHDLRRIIQEKWTALEDPGSSMRVHLLTFGFKYGVPIDADLVFDLRFLPNPYFDEKLRPLSGKDPEISEYVLESEIGRSFKERFVNFLCYLLPLFAQEGRYRVTVALGCTGGRHRSVATGEMLNRVLRKAGYAVTLEHRHYELG